MTDPIRVLFVCARNDARSLMAEALLRHADAEHFEACSAGLVASEIDPRALASLEHIGIDTQGLRSKAIDEFAGQPFHYLITLCDKSSEEVARMPSSGEVIAWSFEDPSTSERPEPFRHCLQEIHDRLHMFITVKTRP
ncbi:arsenate reductase ArsC [Pseudomonas sp. NPDC089530]|uniref:arsenate reductase ArsC n=1 Tax=Pseudomonas sp. NPDC089530 TaxID=3390651 RepID=UPI003D0215C6